MKFNFRKKRKDKYLNIDPSGDEPTPFILDGLLAGLQANGVSYTVQDGFFLISDPKGVMDASDIAIIRRHNDALVAYLKGKSPQ